MSPLLLLAVQIAFVFAALVVLASTVAPGLHRLGHTRALQALLWLHVGRVAPLALLAPGQTDPSIPRWVLQTIAWGDFGSAVLALVAIVALRSRGARGVAGVWAFMAFGTLDILVALTAGLGNGVHEQPLGAGWYVLGLYVPIVCVSQAMIGAALLRPDRFASCYEGARA